jgi:transcriptional regulator with PAS, ATPase and Fis domain
MLTNISQIIASQLEAIEVLRSSLRWSRTLEYDQIQSVLEQVEQMRSELLLGLHSEPEPEISAKKTSAPAESERKKTLSEDFVFRGIFGENEQLFETLEVIKKSAIADIPVLIFGESGTGKELAAQMLHLNSKRRKGPFITINCGAIPEGLIESELFGHMKGAFTGAYSDRRGKFETASGGTIFLDEIGDLPLSSQVKILRVLQEREIQRLGSEFPVKVDVRVVSATHRNLREMAEQGLFREDLFYRLSVIEVETPPLRERRDEIPILIDYFVKEASEALNRDPINIDTDLIAFFLSYKFPGNIRELKNIIYRIVALAEENGSICHLPTFLKKQASPDDETKTETETKQNPLQVIKDKVTKEAERTFIIHGLTTHKGHVTKFANDAGLNRSYLQNLMKKHRIEAKRYREKK